MVTLKQMMLQVVTFNDFNRNFQQEVSYVADQHVEISI